MRKLSLSLVLFILFTFSHYGGIIVVDAAGMLAHTLVGYRTTKYFGEVTPNVQRNP